MKKKIISIVLLYTSIYLFGFSSQVETKYGYKLQIPSGWIIIPEDTVNAYREKLLKESGLDTPPCDYAMQLRSASFLFQRPFVIISKNNDGPISISEIRNLLKTDDDFFRNIYKEIKEWSSGIINITKLNKQYYDQKKQIIYFVLNGYVQSIGDIIHLQAWILTKNGYIQVVSSSLAGEFEKYQDDFKEIITSIEIENNLMYRKFSLNNIYFSLGTIEILIISILLFIIISYSWKKFYKIKKILINYEIPTIKG